MNPNQSATEMCRLNVAEKAITALTPFKNNPRTHSAKQIRQIADSLKQFGWTNPVLTDGEGMILAGHGRVAAAKLLGLTKVPVICIDRMSESEKRAYIIADNKLAENAGWDPELLAIELQFLVDSDLSFDVELTGFDMGEIDVLLAPDVSAEEELVEQPDADAPVVSRPGDLWLIGAHRILCGNALEGDDWKALMGGMKAQLVFTDPPYNVPISGHVSGLGQAKHREFAMASGEMSKEGFTGFLRSTFLHLAEHSVDGAIHFVCMDWRHMGEILEAAGGVYSELKNLCVWAKTNAGMGSFYRSQHELVFAFKSGKAAHINNFGLGENGRHRSNLWTYAGANTFRAGRMEDLEAHPTVKPLGMVSDAILDCSKRGGLVVDAFAGSGTTLIAAARCGRVGAGLEIDPAYVDLIVRRLEAETGEQAVHGDTLDSFEELKAERLREDL
jgi:DNA modification methylase